MFEVQNFKRYKTRVQTDICKMMDASSRRSGRAQSPLSIFVPDTTHHHRCSYLSLSSVTPMHCDLGRLHHNTPIHLLSYLK